MDEDTAFHFVWSATLLAPPFAVCAFVAIRRWFTRIQTFVLLGCVAIVAAVLVLGALRISSTVASINLYAIAVAYLAYCYVAVSCWKVRKPLFRRVALGAAMLPVAYGYLVGTLGSLALAFAVGDYVRPPEHVEQYRQGLTCRITSWGFVANSGQTVHLYRSWAIMPFFEKEIARIVINDADQDARASLVSCSAVAPGHIS